MATEEIKTIKWTCDGCAVTRLVPVGDPRPDGFYIPMVQAWTKGKASPPAAVWAHHASCVRRAVENALQEALSQEDERAARDEAP